MRFALYAWSGGPRSHEGNRPRCRLGICSRDPAVGHAPRAPTPANGSSIHHRHGADAGTRYRRDYFDFYLGTCRIAEVAQRDPQAVGVFRWKSGGQLAANVPAGLLSELAPAE